MTSIELSPERTEPRAPRSSPADLPRSTLLVIGIHREELAFGETVAQGLDLVGVRVLRVADGLSGRHPRADERFRYETLHRALYLQLLPHVVGHHRLLIDLHSGMDSLGPSADLMGADPEFLRCLRAGIKANPALDAGRLRLLRLDDVSNAVTKTIIPSRIWNNPLFLYLGMEIYLPESTMEVKPAADLARRLIAIAADCAQAATDRGQRTGAK